jgi:hypothetical protein
MCLVREGRQNSVWNAHNQTVDEPDNIGVGIQLSRLSAIKIHRLEVLIVSGATPLEQTPFHEGFKGIVDSQNLLLRHLPTCVNNLSVMVFGGGK